MKTLVKAKLNKWGHPDERGQKYADWLNSLGPDSAPYTKTHTVGRVRKNYLRHSEITHIELS